MYTNLNRKGWGYVSKDKMPPMGKGPGGKKMPGGGPKPKNMKKTLGTLLRYLGKYKVFLAIVLVLVVFNSFAMVAGSYFLKPLVNNYILPGDFAGLAKMLVLLGAIFLGGACSAYGYARIMVHVSQNTIRDIRRDLFNKMQDLPIKYFDRNTHGDLMSLYTNDIDKIIDFYTYQIGLELEYRSGDKYASFLFDNGVRLGIKKAAEKIETGAGNKITDAVNKLDFFDLFREVPASIFEVNLEVCEEIFAAGSTFHIDSHDDLLELIGADPVHAVDPDTGKITYQTGT